MITFKQVKKPHLFIVGLGGTGGFAFASLMRLFNGQDIKIDLYDGDTVEAKNLARQDFAVSDLDQNKAQALADRYQKMLASKCQITVHTQYLTSAEDFEVDLASSGDSETPIVISCVDNISTRRLIDQAVKDLTGAIDIIALDSGNGAQGGQVVVWGNYPAQVQKPFSEPVNRALASMLELFPEINKITSVFDENPGLVSVCAEQSQSKPQTMMANVLNGQIIANAVFEISQNKPLAGNVYYQNLLNFAIKPEEKFNDSHESA